MLPLKWRFTSNVGPFLWSGCWRVESQSIAFYLDSDLKLFLEDNLLSGVVAVGGTVTIFIWAIYPIQIQFYWYTQLSQNVTYLLS